MKFLSTGALRNRSGFVRELAQKEDLVLTANGKPIALLLSVEEGELEEAARLIRQARAQRALLRMRRQAAKRGLEKAKASQPVIDREIRAVRRCYESFAFK